MYFVDVSVICQIIYESVNDRQCLSSAAHRRLDSEVLVLVLVRDFRSSRSSRRRRSVAPVPLRLLPDHFNGPEHKLNLDRQEDTLD